MGPDPVTAPILVSLNTLAKQQDIFIRVVQHGEQRKASFQESTHKLSRLQQGH